MRTAIVTVLLLAVGSVTPASGQALDVKEKKPQKALALSLLLPGLGQRYVQDGSWRGTATAYALADAAALLGFVGAEVYREMLVDDYRVLAVSQAGADLAGKDRTFFLNLATYRSSDAFLDAQLRSRNWNEVDYVSDPSFRWKWASEEAYLRFRDMRDDAESLRRRGTFLVGVLVANRVISGVNAIRTANRANAAARDFFVSLSPPPRGGAFPLIHLDLSF